MSPRTSIGLFSRLLALGLATAALSTACSLPDLPDIAEEEARAAPLPETTVIVDAEGRRITTLHAEQDRTIVPIERIPNVVQDAVVAIEDKRFWEHRGIDILAILRAAATNAAEGQIVQGGSTITQQYVKNTLVGTEVTLARKTREAILAYQLERRYSKPEILERYLNTVYFGEGAYGIQAAARNFFSRPVDRLTLPQAALLAGLIAGPVQYDPVDRPESALERRNTVLDRMLELRSITRKEHREATDGPVRLRLRNERPRYPAPHFVEYVKQVILDNPRFGETYTQRYNLLFGGGLRIETTIDLDLQESAEKAVAGILSQPSDPYGAVTAVDPRTGHIKVMVGGRDFFAPARTDPIAKVNLATGGITGRQAGSAFKPFALIAALERGIPPSKEYFAGSSITIPIPGGEPWAVRNYEGGGFGSLSLERATIASVNVVFAQVIMEVGPEVVVDVAHRMGIRSRLRSLPSAVLGSNEVNTLEMASAYGTLAVGGQRVRPIAISRITDRSGEVVFEARPRPHQVLDPAVAWVATQILRKVILYGTGRSANIARPAAGKTGTAQQWRDAWFTGFTPQLSTSVWVGFPQAQISMVPPKTRIRVTGGSFPAQIWQTFMLQAIADLPPDDFSEPEAAFVSVPIDVTRGCRPNELTPPEVVRVITFVAGTEPTEVCAEPTGPAIVPDSIPSVVGMAYSAAVEVLEGKGYAVDRETEYRTDLPPETVVGQSPAAGEPAQPGTTITLLVSTNEPQLLAVPDVVEMNEEEAVATLEGAGFEANVIEDQCSNCGLEAGTVWRQSPEAGTKRPEGSTITVKVNPSPAEE